MRISGLKSLIHQYIVLLAVFLGATLQARAQANTYWTGPIVSFSHEADTTTADMLTSNHTGDDATNNVWLTRGTTQPLYNAAAESAWDPSISPANTLWAVASGDLTNAASLSYDVFANVVGQPGNSPKYSVGKTFFVKIFSDNIYLTLTLTSWGSDDGGSFSYNRSTPAVITPPPAPAVSLTNPAPGTVFSAPANLPLGADATVSSGTVTNVEFFANGTPAGAVQTAPFTLTTGSLTAGSYALTAVATAAGISATSTLVNVSVVNPVAVKLSSAEIRTGQFSFSYTANTGLSYVIQSSTNLLNWVSLATNRAAASSVSYTNSAGSTGAVFYRVGRMPNP
jgi:hypothetical protein